MEARGVGACGIETGGIAACTGPTEKGPTPRLAATELTAIEPPSAPSMPRSPRGPTACAAMLPAVIPRGIPIATAIGIAGACACVV
eukprot:CAMPEP_0115857498 /NCGR_PEP_ID=MMETSP0287-20121206/15605_1 /TAXON_ID=412157 /ORGANISM="Chrysochromulina rotalis, Strain UIO044" /LENGTH=85 /DNA_ID=CAMNT_0003311717 /DNA_START=688 /DNA_END=941 /DNA_ORIENTATION=-